MKKNADKIDYKVVPTPLEVRGGKVDVAIDGVFPSSYFNKNVTLVATPVLQYAGGETPFTPVTVQGEKVGDNNKVISYAEGGSFAYKDAVDYNPAMRISDLVLKVTATKGKKSVDFEPVKIGEGIIATATLADNSPQTILGVTKNVNNTGIYDPSNDEFQRIVPDHFTADIHYLINSADIRSTELSSNDIKKLKQYTKDAFLDQRKELKNVEVSAYASPDGALDLNTKLSEKREGTSSKYMSEQLKKEAIEAQLNTKFTPEDWDGFRELMEESDIQDKELILRVLSMYNDPEVREREIKNLSEAFTVVADEILPRLRRAKITSNVDLIGKTDEEILAAYKSNPRSLTQAEFLYAAKLQPQLADKLKAYDMFQTIFPDDWRGYNNSGAILSQLGNYEDAKTMFEKAEALKNNEPVIKNNLGAVLLAEGKVKEAEALFGAASGAGPEVNSNLGLVAIQQGQYDKASQLLSASNSNNAALAKILAGDNNGALKLLESNTAQSDVKEYLKAIVAARTAKENLMYESLANAVKINPAIKSKIATDKEFVKYFAESKFKDIVK
ncbi:MAG: hypothetical protein LBR06_08705 [Bacteroidales bacterium]|nr:hypothetical protein [Bacteroidales bacterium]